MLWFAGSIVAGSIWLALQGQGADIVGFDRELGGGR
jgi:hypothetical protein